MAERDQPARGDGRHRRRSVAIVRALFGEDIRRSHPGDQNVFNPMSKR